MDIFVKLWPFIAPFFGFVIAYLIFQTQHRQTQKATKNIIRKTCEEFSALRGGAVTIQDVVEEQHAELDLARIHKRKQLSGPGTEDDIYNSGKQIHPFHFGNA